MELLAQLLATAVVTTAAYSFVALGFSLIFAVTRMFHFAHGALYVLSGYLASSLAVVTGLVPALVVGFAGAAIGALLIEGAVYRPMRRRSATSFTLLAASLGIMLALQGVIGAIWGTLPVGVPFPLGREPVKVWYASVTLLDVAVVVTAAVTVPLIALWLRNSRQGRAMLAVAEDPDVAVSVGVSQRRARQLALGLGTVISAPTAIYLGMRSGLTPDAGLIPLLYAFAALVVGGIGRINGTVPGLAILVFVSTLSTYYLATYWTLPVAFVVLVAFLIWRPTGIFGVRQRATAL